MTGRSFRTGIATTAMLGALVVGMPALGAGTLTLRVQDAIGEPGGRIAVVLRTYASRPIGQGQVCMETASTEPNQGADAVAATEGAQVFSTAGDAVSSLSADLNLDPQQIVLQFTSESATVNATDGPLAVVFLRLADTVLPGEVYDLTVDVQGTSFVDEHGETVQVEPRNGTLTIRAPSDPILVGAHSEDTIPGGIARLSMVTFEPIPLSGGQVGIRYDPAVAGGPPSVFMDPRHGNASFVESFPEPGLVVVNFQSPDGTLNEVPGDLVEAHLPVSETVPPGTLSPVSIDPAFTFLLDAQGLAIPLVFEGGVLEVNAAVPGAVSNLRLAKASGDTLLLSWNPDCGSGTSHGIYRGDLGLGYGSIGLEPGHCDVTQTTATVAAGAGDADFFLVVPHINGEEGSYGRNSAGDLRPPASIACFPQTAADTCNP